MGDASEAGRDERRSLGARTLTGIRWSYTETLIGAGAQVAFTAVMARLLTPVEFGLLAMANVFLAFSAHIARLGLGPALIQRSEIKDQHVRVAFTSGIALGLLVAALLAALAPLVGLLLDNDDVVPVVRAMAAVMVLTGAGLTAESLLRRSLRFRALAATHVGSYLVGYVGVGIGLGVAGAGVWSLVAAALSQATLRSVLAYALVRHRLRPVLRWRELSDLYGYGGQLTAITLLQSLSGQAPSVLVGRFAGAGPLGLFNRAQLLINLPAGYLTESVSRVLFPALSRLQHDRARMADAYRLVMRVTAAGLLPLAGGVMMASPEIVQVVLGPGWGESARVLPWLAGAAAAAYLLHYAGVICDATATLRAKTLLEIGFLLTLAVGVAWAASKGLVMVGAVITGAQVVRLLAYSAIVGRILSIPLTRQASALGGAALTALLVTLGVGGVTALGRSLSTEPVMLLGVQIVTGATIFVVSSWGWPLRSVRKEAAAELARADVFVGDRWWQPRLSRLLGVESADADKPTRTAR